MWRAFSGARCPGRAIWTELIHRKPQAPRVITWSRRSRQCACGLLSLLARAPGGCSCEAQRGAGVAATGSAEQRGVRHIRNPGAVQGTLLSGSAHWPLVSTTLRFYRITVFESRISGRRWLTMAESLEHHVRSAVSRSSACPRQIARLRSRNPFPYVLRLEGSTDPRPNWCDLRHSHSARSLSTESHRNSGMRL